MLSRATFPRSAFRSAHPSFLLPSTHGPSTPLSNIHRLSVNGRPYTSFSARLISYRSLKTNSPPGIRPAQLASSLWRSTHTKSIEDRVIEASNRYSNLSDRNVLLLFLSKQEEIWGEQRRFIRASNISNWVFLASSVGVMYYYYMHLWPQQETSKKIGAQNMNIMFNKLVEIEKRLEK